MMRLALVLLFAAACSSNTETHTCAFVCGVAACYTPIAAACGSAGYIVDSEVAGSGDARCIIEYHCR